MVMVFPASVIVIPVPADSVTSVDPDVLEWITDVVEEPAVTVKDPSLVIEPSTSLPLDAAVMRPSASTVIEARV